jgi:hypothetical protein
MPLLSTALDRSIQTAEAMEARGFGSSQKMRFFKSISVTRFDMWFILGSLGLILFVLGLWVTSAVNFSFYPTLSQWSWTPQYIIILCTVILLVVFPLLLSPLKKVIDVDPVF